MVDVLQESAWVPYFFWPGWAGQLDSGANCQTRLVRSRCAQFFGTLARRICEGIRSRTKPTHNVHSHVCIAHENSDKLVALLDSTALNGVVRPVQDLQLRFTRKVHQETVYSAGRFEKGCYLAYCRAHLSLSPPGLLQVSSRSPPVSHIAGSPTKINQI